MSKFASDYDDNLDDDFMGGAGSSDEDEDEPASYGPFDTEAQKYVWDYHNEVWDLSFDLEECTFEEEVGALYAGINSHDESIVVHPPCEGVMRCMNLDSIENELLDGSPSNQICYARTRKALGEPFQEQLCNEIQLEDCAQPQQLGHQLNEPPFVLHRYLGGPSLSSEGIGCGSGSGSGWHRAQSRKRVQNVSTCEPDWKRSKTPSRPGKKQIFKYPNPKG
jgi:hypothetical protein